MDAQDHPERISPELANSIRETREAWERIEAEFGLLTAAEVVALIAPEGADSDRIASLDQAGQLLSVRWQGGPRHPGFQFDRDARAVFPVIRQLIAAARENGWSNEDLMMWMRSPTSYLTEEDRPVDHIMQAGRVMAAAIDDFEGG